MTSQDGYRMSATEDGRKWRYDLTRTWGTEPPLIFVMLNPSTASASTDDPTIRRCVGFAKRENAGGIYVVNLFALRATKPRALLIAEDPVGPQNPEAFMRVCEWPYLGERQPLIVLAWGAIDKRLMWQRDTALGWLHGHDDRFRCLGVTKAGEPRHPLYVKADTQLQQWP
jgi:hypothetical protein